MNRMQKVKEGKMGTKGIGFKVGCVVAAMQALSVVLAMTICVSMFSSLITTMQEERCTSATNILERELEQAAADEDLNQLLDGLKSELGFEFTIFSGDTRAYSTVMQDGKRVVGTKLSDELIPIVLTQGQSFVGKADILGEPYLCSYVPTKGADGQINGLIFAGISTAQAKQETWDVIVWAAVISIAVILICVIVFGAYLRKRVSKPLGRITHVARQLERGELGILGGEQVAVSIRSRDEIGLLSQIFEGTITRLRDYIGEIAKVLGAIADGNLTQRAAHDYMGDFSSIKESLDSIQMELNRTMGQISASANQVSAGSDQMSVSAQALSEGAIEQAGAVEEVSATLADISKNAQQTLQTAKEAGVFVDRAGAQLGVSMEYVQGLNTAMENISNSSQEISTIIAAIENVAFQINILALNASVEAARAGSAGKGFAVVAEEVRNLAAKSDEAAKATKELIEGSMLAVTEGGEAVNKVTDSLNRTAEFAGNVTTKMAEVVDAVEEQTEAITQVSEGIEQISAVVQTNSATSEECAAASQQLSSQAGVLKNLMHAFALEEEQRQ